jgi:hypothetical protein
MFRKIDLNGSANVDAAQCFSAESEVTSSPACDFHVAWTWKVQVLASFGSGTS